MFQQLFLPFLVGYSVSLTEWEGVQSSVDKEILQRISEFEELCRGNNVRTTIIFHYSRSNCFVNSDSFPILLREYFNFFCKPRFVCEETYRSLLRGGSLNWGPSLSRLLIDNDHHGLH